MRRSTNSPESTLDPIAQRELEAIEATLSGADVSPDLVDIAEFSEAIREIRPCLDDEARRRLDGKAATWATRSASSNPGARLRAWVDAATTYRLAAAAGVATTLLVAVVVGISALGDDETPRPTAEGVVATAVPTGEESASSADATASKESTASEKPAAAAYTADQRASAVFEPDIAAARFRDARNPSAHGAAIPLGPITLPNELLSKARGGVRHQLAPTLEGATGLVDINGARPVVRTFNARTSGNQLGAGRRKLDRDTSLTVSTERNRVRPVADQAVDVVHAHDGQVLSQQYSFDKKLGSSAYFEIEVPATQLDGLVDELSGLGSVESQNETGLDITKEFNTQRAQLADTRAERKVLLERLAEAVDATEIEHLNSLLADARTRIANQRQDFQRVAGRANVSTVSLSIVGHGEGAQGDKKDDGTWGLDDAIDVAGDALRIIGGVLIVAAAILGALGLVGLVIWFAVTSITRQRREQALDQADTHP